MPVCCQCNGRGRCISCACVKSGSRCIDCLPSRNGHCSNLEIVSDADEHSCTLSMVPSTVVFYDTDGITLDVTAPENGPDSSPKSVAMFDDVTVPSIPD